LLFELQRIANLLGLLLDVFEGTLEIVGCRLLVILGLEFLALAQRFFGGLHLVSGPLKSLGRLLGIRTALGRWLTVGRGARLVAGLGIEYRLDALGHFTCLLAKLGLIVGQGIGLCLGFGRLFRELPLAFDQGLQSRGCRIQDRGASLSLARRLGFGLFLLLLADDAIEGLAKLLQPLDLLATFVEMVGVFQQQLQESLKILRDGLLAIGGVGELLAAEALDDVVHLLANGPTPKLAEARQQLGRLLRLGLAQRLAQLKHPVFEATHTVADNCLPIGQCRAGRGGVGFLGRWLRILGVRSRGWRDERAESDRCHEKDASSRYDVPQSSAATTPVVRLSFAPEGRRQAVPARREAQRNPWARFKTHIPPRRGGGRIRG